MSFLTGKRALIVGVASKRSIAYGIAEQMRSYGAELAFTYQGEKLKDRVTDMAKSFDSDICLPLDVTQDEDITQLVAAINEAWPEGFDILIHSVAFAPQDQLAGDYLDVLNREGFRVAHDISSYSFSALAAAFKEPLIKRQGSALTLTYLGAERAVANYNIMGVAKASLEANMRYLAQSFGPHGVRVNAISAGAIKTLAASGIGGFKKMLSYYEQNTPLKRNVTLEQVGNTAAFLCSDLAAGITGEVVHVDSGYHMVGMSPPEER